MGSILGDSLHVIMRDRTDAASVPLVAADHPARYSSNGIMYFAHNIVDILQMVEAGCSIINCSFGPRPLPDDASIELMMQRIRTCGFRGWGRGGPGADQCRWEDPSR